MCDKEKFSANIDNAYEKQTDKVKELFEFAKNRIDTEEEKKAYVGAKSKVNQIYKVRRIVRKSEDDKKSIEKRIDDNFSKMQNKLDINSKNFNFIVDNVARNNEKQTNLIDKLNKESEVRILKNISDTYGEFSDKFINKQLEVEEQLVSNQNELNEKLISAENELSNKLISSQEDAINKVFTSQNEMEKNAELRNEKTIQEIQYGQQIIKEGILASELNTQKEVLKVEKNTQTALTKSEAKITKSIEAKQKLTEKKVDKAQLTLEKQLEKMQKQNEKQLEAMKKELIEMYQFENRNTINVLLQERNKYIKELQEKDKIIKELNLKLYDYEERLEKEKTGEYKSGLFGMFPR